MDSALTSSWSSHFGKSSWPGRLAAVGFVMLAGVSIVACSESDASDDEWPVTIVLDLMNETFKAEGSDIDDGLFCPVGSVHLVFEDSSPTTFYWDIELRCEDGSGSFAVSTENTLEPDEDGEIMFEDPDTGELGFVENSGWWIVEDAIGDYAGTRTCGPSAIRSSLPTPKVSTKRCTVD